MSINMPSGPSSTPECSPSNRRSPEQRRGALSPENAQEIEAFNQRVAVEARAIANFLDEAEQMMEHADLSVNIGDENAPALPVLGGSPVHQNLASPQAIRNAPKRPSRIQPAEEPKPAVKSKYDYTKISFADRAHAAHVSSCSEAKIAFTTGNVRQIVGKFIVVTPISEYEVKTN